MKIYNFIFVSKNVFEPFSFSKTIFSRFFPFTKKNLISYIVSPTEICVKKIIVSSCGFLILNWNYRLVKKRFPLYSTN